MPSHNAEAVYRKIVENQKSPQHARIAALRFLSKPSLALLRRLATDPDAPGRLAALAADLYVMQIAKNQLAKYGELDAIDLITSTDGTGTTADTTTPDDENTGEL